MLRLPNRIQDYINSGRTDVLDGYIRFIMPQDVNKFIAVLDGTDFWESDIPFATSAFGDILAWNSDGFIQLYKMVDGYSTIIMAGDDFFFQNIEDKTFQKDYFDLSLFDEAQKKFGKILPSQCYAFVPVPALGGTKNLHSIQIEDLVTYLSLLSSTF